MLRQKNSNVASYATCRDVIVGSLQDVVCMPDFLAGLFIFLQGCEKFSTILGLSWQKEIES